MAERRDGRSLDDWFMGEIVPHEAALMRFLAKKWRGDEADLKDLRQEIYLRLYAAAAKERPAHPRSFLYQCARNLIVDRIRRSQIVQIDAVMDIDALNVPIDDALPDERVSAREELTLLLRALEKLPKRTREVITMQKIHGYSQLDIAERLSISISSVENHAQRGIRKLADALCETVEIAEMFRTRRVRKKSDRERGK